MRFSIREALYLVVLLAVAGGTWHFGITPVRANIAAYREDTAIREGTLAELDKAKARYPDFDAEIRRLETAMGTFSEKLPERKETADIIRGITEIATANQLTVTTVKPAAQLAAAGYIELPIRLEIEGDFDGFYNLIRQIENLPRITRMPAMTLERLNRGSDGVVSAKLTLSIFFEGDPDADA
ncbi:type IV pilus inner membrane component PilO [Phycisphaera mikurensis]|uniref:Pilus assembly protein PilO n=1 Tax=Phycisphaera mikurensis (strain NBRC 102666 / KCTC 22515 / FYK2301M01) TaxID=1142394 RepID=I0IHW4_PHYMF|nr:type 4a pilus biogenesis protein PilO [Phycisphaera mikurensis]MBB6441093.1 type IV pilus assembly protein PilO [Phycisphaera mikurensis]BAM04852.1 hypothetical protein PSMK_26930 [Phycisphaera mikurensis NBRC 102666]